MATHLKRRIPELRFTTLRGIGWHVSYRDRNTGTPRKLRFNIDEKEREAEARVLYHAWLARHIGGEEAPSVEPKARHPKRLSTSKPDTLSGCLIEIASGLLQVERNRAREGDEPRRQGTIAAPVFLDRKNKIHAFLKFLNERHGANAIARLRLTPNNRDYSTEPPSNRTSRSRGIRLYGPSSLRLIRPLS